MWLRGCPPSVVNLPPTTILPSACTAKAWTSVFPRFAPGLKAVQRAVGVEPPDVVARLPPERGEPAPHHDLAIRLHRQGIDIGISVRAPGLKVVSSVPSGLSRPSDSALPPQCGKAAPHHDLAVCLHRQDIHFHLPPG